MKIYKSILTVVAKASLMSTNIGANSCCWFFTYQPKFPTKLKKKD